MNKQRLKRVAKIYDELVELEEEERECIENLPEGLGETEQAQRMEEIAEKLEEAKDAIEEIAQV